MCSLCCRFNEELAKKVGIPATLGELGVNDVDFDLLAENAMKDICAPGNPVEFIRNKLLNYIRKFLRIKTSSLMLKWIFYHTKIKMNYYYTCDDSSSFFL